MGAHVEPSLTVGLMPRKFDYLQLSWKNSETQRNYRQFRS